HAERRRTLHIHSSGSEADMSARNGIDLEGDPASIVATRILDAPRDLVFRVWTDERHLAEWWGPNGFSTTTSAISVRSGGAWLFVMHGPDGTDYENRITYEEVVRPERLTYRHGGGGETEHIQFRVTVTFEDLGDKTRLTMTILFPSPEQRAQV